MYYGLNLIYQQFNYQELLVELYKKNKNPFVEDIRGNSKQLYLKLQPGGYKRKERLISFTHPSPAPSWLCRIHIQMNILPLP